MVFYGDLHGECFSLDELVPMSTAIARIYTNDGFVIAADGRRLHSRTRSVAGDEEQKIFPLQHQSGQISCAFAGTVQLSQKGSDAVGFDFRVETLRVASELAGIRFKSLFHYTEMLAAEIFKSLEEFDSKFPETGGDAAAHTTVLSLDGFFVGHAKRTQATIYNSDGGKEPEVLPDGIAAGLVRGYGSIQIMNVLFGKDETEQLSSYRSKCQTGPAMTLAQAVEVSLNVIKAHCDPEALMIDRHTCEACGGRIHIATITPQYGFQWVPGFEPALHPLLSRPT